jgi:hypothetical protein
MFSGFPETNRAAAIALSAAPEQKKRPDYKGVFARASRIPVA